MKKLSNILFFTLGITFLFFVFPTGARAASNPQINDSISEEVYDSEKDSFLSQNIEFDLDKMPAQGSLEKKVIDENDVLHTITVEEEMIQGFSILNLNNKTYTVRHTENGVYEASFKIDINSNKIRRVHSDNIKIFRGSISNRQLLRLSDTRARLSFTQRYLLFSTNKSITATISGSTLSVTINQ